MQKPAQDQPPMIISAVSRLNPRTTAASAASLAATQAARSEDAHLLPVLRLGFRPFYLLAASFAALSVPLWVAIAFGLIVLNPALPASLWHAHEMIFGFALAVITGFLFTAGRNWTGRQTPRGATLAAMAALWVAARVLNLTGPLLAAMVADLLFMTAVLVAMGRVLIGARNRRNYFVLLVLGALWLASALAHLALAGFLPVAPIKAIHAGVFIVAMLVSVIGGRVVPSFTANTLPGLRQWRTDFIDQAALAVAGAAFVLVLIDAPSAITAVVCAVAALLHALRLAGWNGWAARRVPLLWILHLSYAWLPVSLALLAASQFTALPTNAAIHALTVGAIGGLIVGMITRTALGHTGQPLVAGRIEIAAYLLVHLAAVTRVAPMLFDHLPYQPLVTLAAVCWSLAFVLYLIKYLPLLTRARFDGRAG